MTAVFSHKEPILEIDGAWVARLKEHARQEPLRRARLNLHHSNDASVHEMLIALCDDTLIAPHRHVGKTESFHVVDGEVLVVFFDDDGRIARRLRLAPPGHGRPFMYRLESPTWHTVIPLTDVVVIHEATRGPFQKSTETPPAWVPASADELRAFIGALKASEING